MGVFDCSGHVLDVLYRTSQFHPRKASSYRCQKIEQSDLVSSGSAFLTAKPRKCLWISVAALSFEVLGGIGACKNRFLSQHGAALTWPAAAFFLAKAGHLVAARRTFMKTEMVEI